MIKKPTDLIYFLFIYFAFQQLILYFVLVISSQSSQTKSKYVRVGLKKMLCWFHYHIRWIDLLEEISIYNSLKWKVIIWSVGNRGWVGARPHPGQTTDRPLTNQTLTTFLNLRFWQFFLLYFYNLEPPYCGGNGREIYPSRQLEQCNKLILTVCVTIGALCQAKLSLFVWYLILEVY